MYYLYVFSLLKNNREAIPERENLPEIQKLNFVELVVDNDGEPKKEFLPEIFAQHLTLDARQDMAVERFKFIVIDLFPINASNCSDSFTLDAIILGLL